MFRQNIKLINAKTWFPYFYIRGLFFLRIKMTKDIPHNFAFIQSYCQRLIQIALGIHFHSITTVLLFPFF